MAGFVCILKGGALIVDAALGYISCELTTWMAGSNVYHIVFLSRRMFPWHHLGRGYPTVFGYIDMARHRRLGQSCPGKHIW